MNLKRKAIIAGVIASLGLLAASFCMGPQVEVRGNLSKQDVADLIRLSRAERQKDIIDWSAPPAPFSIRQITYRWKRLKFESANPIRIDQKPDHKAEVIIGAPSSMRHYQFVNTEQGWKPVTPEFE
jgi:hypothetical protein